MVFYFIFCFSNYVFLSCFNRVPQQLPVSELPGHMLRQHDLGADNPLHVLAGFGLVIALGVQLLARLVCGFTNDRATICA